MTRVYMKLLDNNGGAYTIIGGFIFADIYMTTKSFFQNWFVDSCKNSFFPVNYIVGNVNSEYHEYNNYYFNGSSGHGLLSIEEFTQVNFHNTVIDNFDALAAFSVYTIRVHNITLNNVTIINNDNSGSGTDAIFHLFTYDQSHIEVNDFRVVDSNLGFRSAFYYFPVDNGYLSFMNSSFTNVTLNTGANLIQTETLLELKVENITFDDVKQVSTSDTSNAMLKFGTLNTTTTGSFSVSDITAQQSTVPLFDMASLIVTSNTSKSITLSNIKYIDSVFEFPQDLIIFGNIETDSDFEMIIEEVMMYNLTFNRFGKLFRLGHQTAVPLKISNCQFNDIYGSSVYLESANRENLSSKTLVEMTNITAYDISGGTNSFFVNKEGGHLTVRDSTFKSIENFENGAVINGNFQNSESMFYNCTFTNNTAYYGAVANAQDGSVIKFYDSVISNNFAIQAGAVQSATEGYFEMYNCDVYNNYALSLPVAEIFIVSKVSVIDS